VKAVGDNVGGFFVPVREQWAIPRSLITSAVRSPLRFIVPVYHQDQTPPTEAQGEPS